MTIFNDRQTYIIDGAMGTQIMKAGVKPGICFEELNLVRPDIISKIHKDYIGAGAGVIETNTFGGTRIKLIGYGLEEKFEEINYQGVEIAKNAAKGKALVAASMGPCGELMEPIGSFSFDLAFREFRDQARVFEEAGADLISIETMSDIQEARAAVIAVKQTTKLPVIVHLTYADNGRTITGTPPEVAVAVFEALGADAIGANCSTGPKNMLLIAKRLIKCASIPVSIMSNAGNPEIVDDETVYRMKPEEFAKYAKEFAKIGVKFIGGCCGTAPEHIQAIRKILNPKSKIRKPKSKNHLILSSRTEVVEIGRSKKIFIIGERINPTGRKDLQEELKAGKTNIVRQNAVSQAAAGADILDINVGVPDLDEPAAMKKAVHAVSSSVSVPVCIDSSNADALEEGLKNFAGKALVNSVNGKEESLVKVLPLVKKYGAAVIGLTLEKGIPAKAEERLKIAKKVIGRSGDLGIRKNDILIDYLTLSAGAQQEDVGDTLKAIKAGKKKFGIRTVLGVSNVSHGLPGRKTLNAAFLRLAGQAGLDAAIYNPENLKVKISAQEFKSAKDVFLNKDKGARKWIERTEGQRPKAAGQRGKAGGQRPEEKGVVERLKDAVIDGNKEIVVGLAEEAIKNNDPQSVIDNALLPGMEIVGNRFNDGTYFIPQVMAAAEAMKRAFERVKREIRKEDRKTAGTAVIATVQGDIHDIGKNIVSMLLENHGFRVIDLGKDVAPEIIVKAAGEEKADIVLLSALLTTTMPQMKVVKKMLDSAGLSIPVMVGGAPLNDNFARSMSANFAKDAISAVETAKQIVKP